MTKPPKKPPSQARSVVLPFRRNRAVMETQLETGILEDAVERAFDVVAEATARDVSALVEVAVETIDHSYLLLQQGAFASAEQRLHQLLRLTVVEALCELDGVASLPPARLDLALRAATIGVRHYYRAYES